MSGRPLAADVLFAGVAVRDLATATVTAVAAAGVAVGPVGPVGDAGLKAVATDPDGNEVALIEVHPG